MDFFTAEVWTSAGLITKSVLAFIRVGSRQVCIAGMTPSPEQAWIKQMARNMTLADTGLLHFHAERNHQGKDNVILFPQPENRIGESSWPIQNRERLGGLLNFYYREAA